MPMHNGLLPREGFKMDAILRLIRATALNPKLLLPLVLRTYMVAPIPSLFP